MDSIKTIMRGKIIAAVLIAFLPVLCCQAYEPDISGIIVYLDDCDIKGGIYPAKISLSGELYQWNIPFVKAEAAWGIDAVGQDVRIAVIDSGIYSNHPDIDDSLILPGKNYFTGNDNTSYDALHGTRVAGIIAAIRNNDIGINGIADKVQIVPLKCFEYDVTSLDRIINAIYDAIDVYGCNILNMSFGTYINTQDLSNAMQYAESKGVITIAAVGNTGDTRVYYPAGYDTVIGVGGVDTAGIVSVSSQKNHSVTISAPGELIVSTAYSGEGLPQYTTDGGTSIATPHVTALAAIVKSIHPDITPAEFRQLLINTADDAGSPGWDDSYGYGYLNIEKTVSALLDSMLVNNIKTNRYTFNKESTKITVDENNENDMVTVGIEDQFILTNTTRASKNALLIIGIYDENNTLIAVKVQSVKMTGFGEPTIIQTFIEFQANPEQDYTQKVFLWDLFESMLPLTKSDANIIKPIDIKN